MFLDALMRKRPMMTPTATLFPHGLTQNVSRFGAADSEPDQQEEIFNTHVRTSLEGSTRRSFLFLMFEQRRLRRRKSKALPLLLLRG